MDLHLPYVLPLLGVTAIMGALAVYAWSRRHTTGAPAFGVLVLALALWSFAYSFELLSVHAFSKLFWMKVEYIGIVAVPVAWLAFALSYTGSRRAAGPVFGLLAIEPLCILGLVWTNDWHGFHWATLAMPLPSAFPAMQVTYGPSFWLHTVYSYLCLLVGCAVIGRSFVRSPGRYRQQSAALLLAACAPLLGNLVYLLRLSPVPQLDLTPFGFAVTGIALAWALFRLHMLEIAPVAHYMVVEGMRDPVIVLDARDRITSFNPSARIIVGHSDVDVLGRSIAHVLPWWDDTIPNATTLPEVAFSVEGITRYYDLRLANLTGRFGRLRGRVAVLHEITERKRAEDALRALYDAQSSLVIELAQAKQTADAANRAKTEFISFVSHELKTPMAAVRGYTDLMQLGYAGPISEAQTEYLESIRANIDTMALLVSDLNDAARLETGNFSLDHSHVMIDEIITQVRRANDSLIQAKQHRFVVAIEKDLPFLYGDRTRIIQVLTNLVGNACKYTPSGGVITVEAKLVEGGRWTTDGNGHHPLSTVHRPFIPEPCMQISIRDSGIGISSNDQLHLFEKFFRASDAKLRGIPGTGLGLHIVKHLIELHGGAIWVESTPGSGTTFSFTLPVAADSEPIQAIPAELMLLGAR